MSETYQFIWGEVPAIEKALRLVATAKENVKYGHLETDDFDIDFDLIGIRIRIPHDPILTEERKGVV